MKRLRIYNFFALVFVSLMASSCTAIAGIFKAGMGLGIFIAIAVILIIIVFVMRANKK